MMKELNNKQFLSATLSTTARYLYSSRYFCEDKIQVQLIQHVFAPNKFKSIDTFKNADKIHIFFLDIWT